MKKVIELFPNIFVETIWPINFKLRIQLPCGGRQKVLLIFVMGEGGGHSGFQVTEVKKVMVFLGHRVFRHFLQNVCVYQLLTWYVSPIE